ncbi:MAG TPA: LapA family protein [Trueperaceae bacterium]|nr:LapA family protein [Trueperaceae bacterium]
MKGVRIIQVILLVLVAVYLWLFHSANPDLVRLPLLTYFLPPIPVVYVVGLALVLGLAIGFIPARLTAWRRGRELTKTKRELSQLQVQMRESDTIVKRTGTYYAVPELPVIPDRGPDASFDMERDEDTHA